MHDILFGSFTIFNKDVIVIEIHCVYIYMINWCTSSQGGDVMIVW